MSVRDDYWCTEPLADDCACPACNLTDEPNCDTTNRMEAANMTTYRVTLPWMDRIEVRANLADASAPIEMRAIEGRAWTPAGDWSATGYQTADARHDLTAAVMLAVRSCGREWFGDPRDERDDDDVLAGIAAATEIEVAND